MTNRQESAPLDPVTLEVMRNALPAITDEMGYDLQRTSYNMMIYEVRDYCTALLDTTGALISQNIGGVSHFVADLGVVIRDGIQRFGLDGFFPGDVVMHNHQATAGQHLNNVVIYTPVFYRSVLVAFAVVRAHWADIGGLSTGFGGTGAYDPWSEGLQVDQLKIYEKGEPDKKVLKLIQDNVRYSDAAAWETCARSSPPAGSASGASANCSTAMAWTLCSGRSRRSMPSPRAEVPEEGFPPSNCHTGRRLRGRSLRRCGARHPALFDQGQSHRRRQRHADRFVRLLAAARECGTQQPHLCGCLYRL